MNRALVGVVVLCALPALVSTPIVSSGPRNPIAQLGFIQFCSTSMSDATARLGPAKDLSNDPESLVRRGWYDPADRAFLLLDRLGDAWNRRRGLKGAPPIVMATFAAGTHLQAYLRAGHLTVGDLGRSRFPLSSLRGPNGITLGSSRATIFRTLGASQFVDRSGDAQSYSYFDVYPAVRRAGCGVAGFILSFTLTGDRLTRIEITEAS